MYIIFASDQIPICHSRNEEGIVTSINDVHPIKAEFPISVKEEGIVICVNYFYKNPTHQFY